LSYEGNPENPQDVIALIGKGVCFDSGGLNIKTAMMDLMYFDKGGACTTLGAFRGAVESGLKINLVLGLALVENFLGDNAYRPSDIIKSLKGITVEIGNTDAEGRLILADTMTWAQRQFKPNTVIDVATLTGACMIALGYDTAGLFSNDDTLVADITEAGAFVLEPFWRLPINPEFRNAVKSDVADLTNLAKMSPFGGASTAAAFLENFVEPGVKWAHLDIAGAIYSAADKPNRPKGANGFGASTLLNYLWRRAGNSIN
jgi:leucyl aminopeptidase